MDSTAPKDNDQNSLQDDQGQQDNPIQPGQYVVAGDSQAEAQRSPDLPAAANPQQPISQNPLQPSPNTGAQTSDLERDLKQTVAQATGAQIDNSIRGNQPQTQPQDKPATWQDEPKREPAPFTQPDPTPFVQTQEPAFSQGSQAQSPQTPSMGQQPLPQQTEMDSGSKMGKIIPIIVGVVALVAIAAAVAWFFVINRRSSKPTSTLKESQTIETPASPSPATGRGFGEIEQSASPQASPVLQGEESVGLTEPNVETVPPANLTTQ